MQSSTEEIKKLKQLSSLKSAQLEHYNLFQQKFQQDAAFLEDIRTFMRQRSIIEKEYAQSLLRLVQQLSSKRNSQLNSETVDNVDAPVEHGFVAASRKMTQTWKIVLSETEKIGRLRLDAAESCLLNLADGCKQVRMNRCQAIKLVLDRLAEIQKEVTSTVQELNKSQKIYRDEQHVTFEARQKAELADSKLKSKTISRFTSVGKLQQQMVKCNMRTEACEAKSTEARNQYLLNIAASNVHIRQYYNVDLPALLKTLDGDMYEQVQEFFVKLAEMDRSLANITTSCAAVMQDDASRISRDYDVGCFLKDKPVMSTIIQYKFEPQDNDQILQLYRGHGADLALSKEARKWSAKVAREMRAIRRFTKELNKLSLETDSAAKTAAAAAADGSKSVEVQREELRNALRKAESGKLRAEARLDLLREGGVNVDEWMKDVNLDDDDESDHGVVVSGRNSPALSVNSNQSSGREQPKVPVTVIAPQPNRRTSVEPPEVGTGRRASVEHGQPAGFVGVGVDVGETFTETNSVVGSGEYPVWCVVLYDYEAANPDELNITENDSLEIIGTGDCDGWLKARNASGDEGFVPQNYVRFWNPIYDSGENDSNEVNVDDDTSGVASLPVEGYQEISYPSGQVWARAMFDYCATCDEELSFREGQLILVQSKEHDGVDDGWWVGELNGAVGVFPSLMVEELFPEAGLDEQTPENLSSDEQVDSTELVDRRHSLLNSKVHLSQSCDTSLHLSGRAVSSDKSSSNARSAVNLQYLFAKGAESSV